MFLHINTSFKKYDWPSYIGNYWHTLATIGVEAERAEGVVRDREEKLAELEKYAPESPKFIVCTELSDGAVLIADWDNNNIPISSKRLEKDRQTPEDKLKEWEKDAKEGGEEFPIFLPK